jgi:hypothetical protein
MSTSRIHGANGFTMNPYNGFSGQQREKAQRWLNAQWAAGTISKPSKCCACGQTRGIIHAHAEDYSEPFGDHTHQYPLCYRCHICLHCRHRNEVGWERFKLRLRFGYNWEPMFNANFQRIQNTLNDLEKPVSQGEPRDNLIFDEMKI